MGEREKSIPYIPKSLFPLGFVFAQRLPWEKVARFSYLYASPSHQKKGCCLDAARLAARHRLFLKIPNCLEIVSVLVYPLYGRNYSRRTVGKGALSDTKYFNWVASLKLALRVRQSPIVTEAAKTGAGLTFELHPFMSINVKSPI
ncbi:MAG: hypothetical protein KME38_17250 [Spirirestis rafaelensis WJT71-NPBG6]|nr:hypothetical protein [Spirirestis rafaelensis WJT71-NPBG6]